MLAKMSRGLSAWFVAVLLGGALTGCGMHINRPESNAQVRTPIAVVITWDEDLRPGSLKVTLDTIDVTSQFTVDNAAKRAIANLTGSFGGHTLRAQGDVWQTFYAQYSPKDLNVTFGIVPSRDFRVEVTPLTLTVQRGGSGTYMVGISGDMTDTVSVTSQFPAGVTSSSPSSFAAGVLLPQVPVTVAVDVLTEFSESQITLRGSATVDGQPLIKANNPYLKVIPAEGPFVEVVPGARTAGQTLTSPDGRFTANITAGGPSSQPLGVTFSTTGGQGGAPIGFSIGSSSNQGGVGFCAASAAGVVLSGNNSTAVGGTGFGDHLFSVVNLRRLSEGQLSYSRFGVTRMVGNRFEPLQIFLSPDCTIALIVDANNTGASANKKVTPFHPASNAVYETWFFNNTMDAMIISRGGEQFLRIVLDGTPWCRRWPAGLNVVCPP